ncbi:hypothetical protein S83_019235, partial [Arachis hypogaea]
GRTGQDATRSISRITNRSVLFWINKHKNVQRGKVMDVFIKAAEYMKIPVCKTDDGPLQKLFMLVRSELNLASRTL